MLEISSDSFFSKLIYYRGEDKSRNLLEFIANTLCLKDTGRRTMNDGLKWPRKLFHDRDFNGDQSRPKVNKWQEGVSRPTDLL